MKLAENKATFKKVQQKSGRTAVRRFCFPHNKRSEKHETKTRRTSTLRKVEGEVVRKKTE